MKYYCRTTHDHNNQTREWDYRDLEIWKTDETILRAIDSAHPYTCGVHSFEISWEPLYRLVDNTYEWLKQDYLDNWGTIEEFETEVTKKKVEEQLLSLIECYKKYDMVREK